MDNGIIGKHLYGLVPGGVYRLVLGTGHRIEFRQIHPVGYRDVRVLADDAIPLDDQQRELALDRGGFHYVTHGPPPFSSGIGTGGVRCAG